MTDELPAGAAYVPGSLSLVEGPWTASPGAATITGHTIKWNGTIGGNPLHVPDAVIQYAVVVSATSGTLANTAALQVEQILIDTDTFGDPLAVSYLWPKLGLYIAGSQVELGAPVYLPTIYKD
jgi:hypothetical protein